MTTMYYGFPPGCKKNSIPASGNLSEPFGYSAVKDITTHIVTRFKQIVQRGSPKGTLEHVSEIIVKLARDGRVKKLSFSVDDIGIDLRAEFKGHNIPRSGG